MKYYSNCSIFFFFPGNNEQLPTNDFLHPPPALELSDSVCDLNFDGSLDMGDSTTTQQRQRNRTSTTPTNALADEKYRFHPLAPRPPVHVAVSKSPTSTRTCFSKLLATTQFRPIACKPQGTRYFVGRQNNNTKTTTKPTSMTPTKRISRREVQVSSTRPPVHVAVPISPTTTATYHWRQLSPDPLSFFQFCCFPLFFVLLCVQAVVFLLFFFFFPARFFFKCWPPRPQGGGTTNCFF